MMGGPAALWGAEAGEELTPRILSQPRSVVVSVGENVRLEVTATGSTPLGFQWRHDQISIPTARTSALALTNLDRTARGSYEVVVSNRFGMVTSRVAQIEVIPPLPGTLDLTVAPNSNPNDVVRAVVPLPSGMTLIAGHFSTIGLSNAWRVARLDRTLAFDPTFQVNPGADGLVYCMAVQPDGRILIGGDFSAYNQVPRWRLARLNPDGSLDETFRNEPAGQLDGPVWAIAVQSDGRILIGGDFASVDGRSFARLARLTDSGELDPSFGVEGQALVGGVRALVIQDDDHIYVGSTYGQFPGLASRSLAVLDAQGQPREDFQLVAGPQGPVSAIALQPDGRILVGGAFSQYDTQVAPRVVRVLPNGSLDPSFDVGLGPDQVVTSLKLQSDGRLLVGGGFTTFNQQPRQRLVRLLPDGALDPLFDPDLSLDSWVETIALAPEGKLLVGGDFLSVSSQPVSRLARLHAADPPPFAPVLLEQPLPQSVFAGDQIRLTIKARGYPLPSFQWFRDGVLLPGATSSVLAVPNVRAADAGSYTVTALNPQGAVRSAPAQVTVYASPTTPGAPDIGFFGGKGPDGAVYSILPASDGRAYLGGTFTNYDGTPRAGLVRVTLEGNLDPEFVPLVGQVQISPSPQVYSLVRDKSDKLWIGGAFSVQSVGFVPVVRLLLDGTADPSFAPRPPGASGVVVAMAEQPDGSMVVAYGQPPTALGLSLPSTLRKYLTNGDVDFAYQPEVLAVLPQPTLALATQSDGRLLVVGGLGASGALPSKRTILRLLSNGRPDDSFDPGSGANSVITSVAVQPDGQILIAGAFTRFNGRAHPRIARLNRDGTIDPSFQVGFGPDHNVDAIRLLEDGRIYIAGQFTSFDGIPRTRVARLNPNGSLDLGFDPMAGPNERVRALAVDAGGGLWIGGTFTRVNDLPRPSVARLLGGDDSPLPPSILAQPYADPVFVGMDVPLSVVAEGTLPLTYQWRGGAGPLMGETNWVLWLKNVRQSQQGVYSVGLSNALGRTRSVDVEVVVNPAPVNAGATDLSFYSGYGPNDQVRAVSLMEDGGVLIGGLFNEVDGVRRNGLAKLKADGGVDLGFDTSGGPKGTVTALFGTRAGNWIAGGSFVRTNQIRYTPLVRYLASGVEDAQFKAPLFVQDPNAQVLGIREQSDGQLLVFGNFVCLANAPRYGLFRMSPDGSVDLDYRGGRPAPGGLIHAVAILPDDRCLVGGSFGSFDNVPRPFLVRLDRAGNLDGSFNPNLNGEVRAIKPQPDGRILIAGGFQIIDGIPRPRVARLMADGRVDPGFDPSTGPNNLVYNLHLQSDRKILIGGLFTAVNGVTRNRLARLLPNGSLDRELDPQDGFQEGSSYLDEYGVLVDLTAVHAVAQQPDGQIVVGGEFTRAGKLPRNFIARVNDRERLPLLQWTDSGTPANTLALRWENGILQTAPDLTGPWTDLRDAVSPTVIAATQAQRYFRLRLR